MTRIDELRTPGSGEIGKLYRQLLREGEALKGPETSERRREERKLAEACKDFEKIFIEQVLKEMRRGLNEGASFGTSSASTAADKSRSSFFRDQMYGGFADHLAKEGSFGLGDVLFEQLYRSEYGSSSAPDLSAEAENPPESTAGLLNRMTEQRRHLEQLGDVRKKAQLTNLYEKF